MTFINPYRFAAGDAFTYFVDLEGLDEYEVDLGVDHTFDYIKFMLSGRTDRASSVTDDIQFQINGDTGNNYNGSLARFGGAGGSVESDFSGQAEGYFCPTLATSAPTNVASTAHVTMTGLSETSLFKALESRAQYSPGTTLHYIYRNGSDWLSTSKVETIRIFTANGSLWEAGSELLILPGYEA